MSTHLPSFPRLAFVDLETTGGTLATDRITEVGIVEVDEDGVREWSSLVNPEMPIPAFIQNLTGISNEMVREAPTFGQLADEIHARLEGRVFIAHNARFDHGFLKQAFGLTGHTFRPSVLCTVRLSRKLYPQYERHNLDALVARHRLQVAERHRALGDAQLIWQFWQRIRDEHEPEALAEAVARLTKRPSLPPRLDPAVLERLPATHGVYLFYGANEYPLYIGKANNLRRRVLSHFSGDHASDRELTLCQQTERVEWVETAGELGALLQEALLVKERMPAQNKKLRHSEDLCAWRLLRKAGRLQPVLARPDGDLFFAHDSQLYGLFTSSRAATEALRSIAEAHQLCPVLLGLEKLRAGQAGRPCFASQIGKCSGACAGHEDPAAHDERVLAALESLRLKPWPYAGAIGIREGEATHVVDAWAYVGTGSNQDELARLVARGQQPFDRDVYQILQKWLPKLGPRISLLQA
ncbi:3'-5' exonuclease family protein [Lacisediminimonas profundi]|uniref:3'-5' exonuclease family protein n=1 Tax=Lacisediminimonas profundi TaxID=2603856 RepID=UPI00124B0830|nr:3'-5' exonuclease family protein [Lacisediminimonas profundi]